MDINEMTRKQFEELPYLDNDSLYVADSVILLPTNRKHHSGYNYFIPILCYHSEALGKLSGYDVFDIMDCRRVSIYCLHKSKLIRVSAFDMNEYVCNPFFLRNYKKRKFLKVGEV